MSLESRRSFGMQQTVRLLGDLGERYGSEHKYYDLRSPAEAIKLLCINEPEFVKEIAQAHEHGIRYTVVQADEFLDYGDLHLPLGKNDLIVTPVVAGSGGGGGGIGKILIGAALVAVAIANPAVGLLGGGALGFGVVAGAIVTFGATLAAAAGTIGIGLLLTGTAQLPCRSQLFPLLEVEVVVVVLVTGEPLQAKTQMQPDHRVFPVQPLVSSHTLFLALQTLLVLGRRCLLSMGRF